MAFRQINRKTGNRLKQQLVDAETGEVVDSENKGSGFEIGRNQFVLVEDKELEIIQIESTRTIEIDSLCRGFRSMNDTSTHPTTLYQTAGSTWTLSQ